MRTHELKLYTIFCDDVLSGRKNFEIRDHDRLYQEGDHIKFIPVDMIEEPIEHEISKKEYEITYVLSNWGIKPRHVALGIKECN